MDYLTKYWSEIFAVITGLIYIFLEVKQNKWMWIVGFFSSLVFVYVFFTAKIYANMAMYGYYVLISVYGYWKWSRNGKWKMENGECRGETCFVFTANKQKIQRLIGISLMLSISIGILLAHFTDSPIPYYDGLTTGFSAVATWMLTQKIIQHWYFWIGINIFCVPLYASQGLYHTAFLFFVYFVMSIIGLQQWKKDLQKTL